MTSIETVKLQLRIGSDPRVGESSSVSQEDRRPESSLRRRNAGSILLTQSPKDFRPSRLPGQSTDSYTGLSNSVRSWLSEFVPRVLIASSVYLVAHRFYKCRQIVLIPFIICQRRSLGTNAQVHSKI
jgi:hypothetical protein